MPTKETLGVEQAQRAVEAVLAKGASSSHPFAVALVDENGEMVLMVRQDGASASDVQNAERKAYTAAYIARDTSIYRQQIKHDGRTVTDWSNTKITTLHGGITLHRMSQVIGGIGVSGSKDEDEDEKLALAGAEALVIYETLPRLTNASLRPRLRPNTSSSIASDIKFPSRKIKKITNLPGLSPLGSVAPDFVEVGGLFFTSGITGIDLITGEIPANPELQFRNAWSNLQSLVEAAGRSIDEIGLVTNFIDNQDFRPHINAGWLELFPDPKNRPARKTTSYPLPNQEGVQLQAIGVVDEKRTCIEVEGLTHKDPLPNGVRMGDYIFSSVIVPWDLSTAEPVIGEDAQTDKCFENMRVFMEQAGGTIDDIALQWVYLNDFAYQPYMVDVYLEAWPINSYQAARKTFRYPMGGQIQIQVIGNISPNRSNHEIEGHGHHDPIPMGARLGNLFCSSGVSGVDPTSNDKLEPVEGIEGQAAHGLQNLISLIQSGKGVAEDIGLVTILVQDYADLVHIDKEWVRAFPNEATRPARQIMKMGVQRKSRVQYHMIGVI
tara:strand:- start:1641 stop:3290 length:1650 start_codon:yes stop_codon:yes gene_type:complete